MKRIGVLTAGGDAPGMNAAVRAVVRAARQYDMSVIGFKLGYEGVLLRSRNQDDDFELLTSRSVSGIIHKGGTILMTGRCPEFLQEETQKQAIRNLRSLGVEGLICIGGNGTLAGARSLNDLGFPTIGLPGTIDNDLAYTDFTIGFDTALNTALECVNRIRETGEAHGRVSMITVMGRDCGDLAVYTGLASGAEIVLVPEVKWTLEGVAEKIRWCVLNGKRSMIVVFAEGATKSLESDVDAICAAHPELSEISTHKLTSSQVADILETLSGQETRATVLGYTQRGGTPTASDRILATRVGTRAVELLKNDISGMAVGIHDNHIIETPLSEALQGATFDPDLYRLIDVAAEIK